MKISTIKDLAWIPLVFVTGVILELLLVGLGKGNGLGEASNIYVMAGFFAVAGWLYLFSGRCLYAGKKIQDDLERVKDEINRLSTEKLDILQELRKEEYVFSVPRLRSAFGEFKEELQSIEKVGKENPYSIDAKVNIGDYINEELIDAAISANFLNLIPTTLTGLGILGTFLGLSIGLNSFDLTGSAAEVEANIGPLMDGIKVAFHTSICGLCYSILYNFFYRKTYVKIADELDCFLEMFQKYVIPSTENGTANTFLKYQANICRLLEQQTRLEWTIVSRQDTRFAELAKKLDEQNKQTLFIYERTSKRVYADHAAAIQKTADEFVREINRLFAGNFHEMEEMARSLNVHQQSLKESLSENIGQICAYTKDLAGVHEGLGGFISQIQEFMGDTGRIQEILRNNIEKVSMQNSLQNEQLQQQAKLLEQMAQLWKAQENQINQMLDRFVQNMYRQMDILQQMGKDFGGAVREEVSSISAAAEECSQDIRKEASVGVEMLKEANKRAVTEISETIQKLSDHVEQNAVQTSEMLQELNIQIQEKRQTAADNPKDGQNVLESMESMDEIVRRFREDFTDAGQLDDREEEELPDEP